VSSLVSFARFFSLGVNHDISPSFTLNSSSNSNLSESQVKCDSFFSSMRIQGRIFVYLLHGHGTGALKTKLRDWLSRERQYVKRFAPAEQADGGDAFTLVELKRL